MKRQMLENSGSPGKTAILCAVCLVLCASQADAARCIDTFEGDDISCWTAAAESTAQVTEDSPARPANGYAIADAQHTKVLAFGGTVSRSLDGSGLDIQSVDVLVKVACPNSDPDSAKLGAAAENAVALAFSADGRLMGWFGGTGGFIALSDTVYAEDTWHRLTTVMDKTNSKVYVAVDGTLLNEDGWALGAASVGVSSLSVVGDSAIDDVVVKDEASGAVYDKYAAVDSTGAAASVTVGGITVPTNYLTVNGKAATVEAAQASIENSSPTMTVAQAYQVGVAPVDGATFAITAAEPATDGIVLSFPGSWPAGSYTIKTGNTPSCEDTAQISAVKDGDVNKVTLPRPESGVLYYKVAR